MNLLTNKKRVIIATSVAAAFIALAAFFWSGFVDSDSESFLVLKFIYAILLAVAVGALVAIKPEFNEKYNKRFGIGMLLVSPIFSFSVVESMNDNFLMWFTPAQFLMNVCWYVLIYAVIYAITNRIRTTILIANASLWLLALINYTVLLFRGTPLLPWDFQSAGTGLSVLSNYSFSVSGGLIISTIKMVLFSILALKVTYVNKTLKYSIIGKTATIGGATVFICAFYMSSMLSNIGVSIDPWRQNLVYKNNGMALGMTMNVQYMLVESPTDYSLAEVKEIASDLNTVPAVSSMSDKHDAKNTEKPNIIVIMNESLADLSVLGDNFYTSGEYMPFLSELTKNTIRGDLYMSVKGAGTCNSEFEFLTGNTMAFLPSGSRPYQQYIKKDTYSLVSTLNEQGYTSVAIHPYYATGWDRHTVYPLLGFSDFISLEDFSADSEYVRSFISDRESYNKLISLYERKGEDEKLFLFNVTMQNHGGYEDFSNGFFNTERVVYESYYPRANQYVTLANESDQAFKELVEYFKQQDERTIILMFGDHQPTLDEGFVSDMIGKDESEWTLEEIQREYITPFYIWANYDIEEQEIDKISSNYLADVLLETAGLEKTSYNTFLDSLYERIPVINSIGFIDAYDNYYSFDDAAIYSDLINGYQVIQYNNLFDSKNRLDSIFSLPGKSSDLS